MKYFFPVVCLFIVSSPAFAQTQVCPLNNNFSLGNLTHWFAFTGNNVGGNSPSDRFGQYDSTVGAPTGTLGVSSIPEYNLGSVAGIHVLTASTTDPYGSFPTV